MLNIQSPKVEAPVIELHEDFNPNHSAHNGQFISGPGGSASSKTKAAFHKTQRDAHSTVAAKLGWLKASGKLTPAQSAKVESRLAYHEKQLQHHTGKVREHLATGHSEAPKPKVVKSTSEITSKVEVPQQATAPKKKLTTLSSKGKDLSDFDEFAVAEAGAIDQYRQMVRDKGQRLEAVKSLKNYQQDGYKEINKALRGQGGEIDKRTEAIKKLMEDPKLQIQQDTLVYRGIAKFPVESLKVGAVIEERGFASTSTYPQVAESFSRGSAQTGVVIAFTMPKGKAIYVPDFETGRVDSNASLEQELLAAPGMRLKITKIVKKRQSNSDAFEALHTVHAEYVY